MKYFVHVMRIAKFEKFARFIIQCIYNAIQELMHILFYAKLHQKIQNASSECATLDTGLDLLSEGYCLGYRAKCIVTFLTLIQG